MKLEKRFLTFAATLTMQHFTTTIKTSEGNLNFYFNRIYTASVVRYHISAIGKDKMSVIANMEMRDESYKN